MWHLPAAEVELPSACAALTARLMVQGKSASPYVEVHLHDVCICPVSQTEPVTRVVNEFAERSLSCRKRFFCRAVPTGGKMKWARPHISPPPVPHS